MSIEKGLGRFPFTDMRKLGYRMADILRTIDLGAVPDNKVWERGKTLDQGSEGACVGFGWTAWENCKPHGYKVQEGDDFAFAWYHRAQELDPWPGVNYSGTSVEAGAKVARERGYLESFVWASSIKDIDTWLITQGPIVLGTNWYRSMDTPTSTGFINVDINSGVRGGHCYMLYGKDEKGNYHLQNSWGDGYADDGTFYLTQENFQRLVHYGEMDACTSAQVRGAAVKG